MSFSEIKDALPSLTRAELAEIARTTAELESAPEPRPTVREVQPSDPGAAAAIDAVFRKHHDLLRRLAQQPLSTVPDPVFLSVEMVMTLHARSLREHGGSGGVRDPAGLERAIGQPHLFA
jgi:hypothetical protein